jgi:hypothetical protein
MLCLTLPGPARLYSRAVEEAQCSFAAAVIFYKNQFFFTTLPECGMTYSAHSE